MDVTAIGPQLMGIGSTSNANTRRPQAVVAANVIPVGAYTLPVSYKLDLKKIFDLTPVVNIISAFVSNSGILYVEQAIDWISVIRIANNCYEQNLVAIPTNDSQIVLKSIRVIREGEELLVWPSIELISALNIPFLSLFNIINDHCYRCHRCGHHFCQPNPLKVHLLVECCPKLSLSPVVNRMSELCESTTFDSRVNSRASEEERGHTCVYCGKTYTRKYGLKIHERTHTGHKPLKCRYCCRPFSDPSNLNKHVRLHSQHQNSVRNPYKCGLCPKVLIRRRDLERHLKTRHQKI